MTIAMPSFILNISHSQICVFDSSLQEPFNNWSKRQVSQGFAWRPGSVSFGTLEEAGPALVNVQIRQQIRLNARSVRAIQVPFDASKGGIVEVASVADSKGLEMRPGSYSLVFETWLDRNRRSE